MRGNFAAWVSGERVCGRGSAATSHTCAGLDQYKSKVVDELAVLLGVLHAAPILPVNFLQVVKTWFGVGGAARKMLQV